MLPIRDLRALAVNISKEVSRKMRATASETLALPFKESAFSFSFPITNHAYLTFASISDGMKSFSNRRWADRNVWFNVPRGTRECCNTHGWPKVQKVRE